MVTDTLGEQIAAPVVDMRALDIGVAEKIDIAPLWSGICRELPLRALVGMRKSLTETERKMPIIQRAIAHIDEEISRRNTTEYVKMRVEDIKIYPCFEKHPPKAEKYEAKSWQYAKSGMGEFDIVLDSQNYLIDGYCGYLLAREHGLTHIPIRYEKRWKVTACHRPGGRLYCWELPGCLYGKVKPGDQLCVPGVKGKTWVKVIEVMEHEPAIGEEPLKVAIRRKRRNSNMGGQ